MAKILMVDDDFEQLATAKQWLTLESHSVETASTGMKGWEMMQNSEFELVILDWDLPDINGIDVLKRFRASGGTTPVLMLTGRTSVDSKAEGLDCGADDYLTKPYHMKELTARIRAALRKNEFQPKSLKPLGSGNEEVLKTADLIGTVLASKFEFLSVIGQGGVGIVLKAKNPHLDKFVAVKMILRTEMKEETVARFEQEARLISRLDHSNIATVYDFGVTERRQPYMVMEFVEGRCLFDVLQDEDHLAVEQALEIVMQVCDGMSHAHGMGIVHRDLKPSNIILKDVVGSQPVAKILDFGCAKLRSIDAPQKAQALTQVGELVGSPPYMSPEQVHGQQLDERSDIYSLGCLLHEAVTGYVPHLGQDPIDTMIKHTQDDVLPLKRTRPDLSFPDELDRVLAKMLSKVPERRQQSMREVRAELEEIKVKLKLKQASSGSWWEKLSKFGKRP
jgi:serine/threonine protein kinase